MLKHIISASIVGIIVWLGLPILEQYITIGDPAERFTDWTVLINTKYLPVAAGVGIVWVLFLKSLIKGMMMMLLLVLLLAAGAYIVFIGF